jgi:hypothetical protein
MLLEAPHHRGTAVEIAPALEVGNRDVKLPAHRLEQIAQIQLLRRDLQVNVEIFPKTDWSVVLVRVVAEMADPAFDLLGDVVGIELLDDNGCARAVFRTDVEGQVAGLAARGYLPFRRIEVAFAQAVTFEDVAPAARADSKIHC